MDIERLATGPLARFAVWLPLATIAGFAALSTVGIVAFPNAVLFVTLLAALGWVAVGFGGSAVTGPFEEGAIDGAWESSGNDSGIGDRGRGDRGRGDDHGRGDGERTGGGHGASQYDGSNLAVSTAVVIYLTVTTALGWAVVAVFFL